MEEYMILDSTGHWRHPTAPELKLLTARDGYYQGKAPVGNSKLVVDTDTFEQYYLYDVDKIGRIVCLNVYGTYTVHPILRVRYYIDKQFVDAVAIHSEMRDFWEEHTTCCDEEDILVKELQRNAFSLDTMAKRKWVRERNNQDFLVASALGSVDYTYLHMETRILANNRCRRLQGQEEDLLHNVSTNGKRTVGEFVVVGPHIGGNGWRWYAYKRDDMVWIVKTFMFVIIVEPIFRIFYNQIPLERWCNGILQLSFAHRPTLREYNLTMMYNAQPPTIDIISDVVSGTPTCYLCLSVAKISCPSCYRIPYCSVNCASKHWFEKHYECCVRRTECVQ